MISRVDIQVGDKVLVNWPKYKKLYRVNSQNQPILLREAMDNDVEFTVKEIRPLFITANCLCEFNNGCLTWIQVDCLHKIY